MPTANAIFTAYSQASVVIPPSVPNQSATEPAGLLNGGNKPS